jgi:hypothetical protein
MEFEMPSEVGPTSGLKGTAGEAPISHKPGDSELKKMHEIEDERISEQQQIARLAHQLWVERGTPEGSPEKDWFEAEQMLAEQRSR